MRDLLLLERISRPEAENAWHVGVGSIAEWEDPIAVERLRELQDDYFRIVIEKSMHHSQAGEALMPAGGYIQRSRYPVCRPRTWCEISSAED